MKVTVSTEKMTTSLDMPDDITEKQFLRIAGKLRELVLINPTLDELDNTLRKLGIQSMRTQ